MSVHELHEQGFLCHAFFVHESEVSIVEESHHLVTLGGAFRENLGDFDSFLFGSGVTGRVVREVQENDLLITLASFESGLEGFSVEAAVLEGIESLNLGATGVFEHEFVVVPVQVRDNHFVAGVEEHVAGAADGMRQGGGHHRIAEALGGKRRVLLDVQFLPGLAEVRVTEARGIQERSLREVQGLENAIQHRKFGVESLC